MSEDIENIQYNNMYIDTQDNSIIEDIYNYENNFMNKDTQDYEDNILDNIILHLSVRVNPVKARSESIQSEIKSQKSITSIASYLCTQYQIFKDQILIAPVVSSSIEGSSISKLLTINTMFKKYAKNIYSLFEPKQNHVIYQLIAWLVEAIILLDSINHNQF
ncbi:10993_t:CDS:2 [Racocetra persica]|uniref:10993_t:CDS:1 n=1 Tax=Racocetra persica TaxID=160502 RepID=A0ACA9M300_9GLOM|nr:10993_t:CDS:2 [Racocetra persica]